MQRHNESILCVSNQANECGLCSLHANNIQRPWVRLDIKYFCSVFRAEPQWTMLCLYYAVCYSLSCVISDFRRGVNEIIALLGCYRCRLKGNYRRFGNAYRFRLQRAAGPICCPETSENNYQSTPCNISEERRCHAFFLSRNNHSIQVSETVSWWYLLTYLHHEAETFLRS